MFKRTTIFHVALMSVALLGAPSAMAAASSKAFGNQYAPVAPVSADQAQVVYYRLPAANAQAGAAHVYVDREFQSALLPGGYTAFCVTPGQHTLGAYVNDAPHYQGKSTDVYSAQLSGGMTYFLRVGEGAHTAPQAVSRTQAEGELAATHQQVHALSRASHVVACNYQPMPAAAASYKDYTLSGDVLFAFGKSGYADISPSGRKAIRELISQLKTEHASLEQIEVIGHTDPIGKPAANHALGLKRAQTVRRLLLDGGLSTSINTSSAGSSEPVSGDCQGSRAAQVACYAADRRVVVRVDLLP